MPQRRAKPGRSENRSAGRSKGRTAGRAPEAETRDRILGAAEALFAARGYSGASLQAIAREAGVTSAMVPYYFKSKSGLYRAVVGRIATDFERMAGEIVSSGKPPVERLRIYLHWFFDYAAKHPNLARLTLMGAGGPESTYLDRIAERSFRPLYAMGVGFIEAGAKAGLFRRVDAPHLLAAVYGLTMPYFADRGFFELLLGTRVDAPRELARRRTFLVDAVFSILGIEGNG
jgi:TetR/AcrR family transcriptional regulator